MCAAQRLMTCPVFGGVSVDHALVSHAAGGCAAAVNLGWVILLYRGVFWDRKNSRWRAQVGFNNRKIFMGYFGEPAEAARAYDKKVVQLHGALGEWTMWVTFGWLLLCKQL